MDWEHMVPLRSGHLDFFHGVTLIKFIKLNLKILTNCNALLAKEISGASIQQLLKTSDYCIQLQMVNNLNMYYNLYNHNSYNLFLKFLIFPLYYIF